MNSLKKAAGTNRAKEEEGVWLDIADGIRVKIRRFNSVASKEAMKRHEKKFARPGKKRLKPEELEELITLVTADAIICAWEGVTDENGDVECDFTNKYAILTDDEMTDFRNFIVESAQQRDVFAHELEEDAAGN